MGKYVIRRCLLIIPTLVMVYTIVFVMTRMLPGNAVDVLLRRAQQLGAGGKGGNREALEKFLGLDVPTHIQYLQSVKDMVLHGDMGTSLLTGVPVMDTIVERLPVTIELGVIALILALLMSVPIGVYSAIRQDQISDYIFRTVSVVFIAAPGFWVATLIILYPSIWWQWQPPTDLIEFSESPLGHCKVFLIPSFILGMAMAGTIMRMTRTMMLETLRQDFIRTAYSKGLREKIVIGRHALKNALIPVVTIAGAELPVLIGGSVIIEQIFSLPGTGRLLVDALGKRDYPMMSAINLIFATAVVFTNLLVDISYAYLDPRIRYS